MSTTLRSFRSPPWEVSFYKGIPIEKYSRQSMMLIREIVGCPVRVMFRGPRSSDFDRSPMTRRSTCLKKNAVTFTVYKDYR